MPAGWIGQVWNEKECVEMENILQPYFCLSHMYFKVYLQEKQLGICRCKCICWHSCRVLYIPECASAIG